MFDNDIVHSAQLVYDHFDAADKARAYIAATETHGHSQQLIDFINYDGGLSQELGLESFGNLSTEMQHALLLANLKPDLSEQTAMEGFSNFIKKFRGWLIGGGAAALFLRPGSPLALIGLGAIIAGTIGFVARQQDAQVHKFSYAKENQDGIVGCLKVLHLVADHLPSDLDVTKWNKFQDDIVPQLNKVNSEDSLERDSGTFYADFKDAGWTVSNFAQSVKWYSDVVKDIDALTKKVENRIENIDHLTASVSDKDSIRVATSCLKTVTGVFSLLKFYSKTYNEILNKTAKCFEAIQK